MTDISIYRQNFEDERSSAAIYLALAEVEKDPRLAEVYRRIAETEQKHAAHWAEKIQAVEGKAPEFRPSWRTRMLLRLGRRFGPSMVLPAIQNMERQGTQGYAQQAGSVATEPTMEMARQENSHARLIAQITAEQGGGMEGGALALLEGRHRSTGGNALRAAVLGANDGLVSNLSLVMGVAGATFNNRTVLITGLAGLLAGAISMALGEWLSVQSSRELFSHQIKIEAAEVATAPEEEAEELSLIYQARGLSKEQADNLSAQLLANPQSAVDTLAREELGVDPGELGGSAWEAALTSFFLFAIGAIIPVIAFTFLSGLTAVIVSILFSTVGLFILGAVITLFTGKPVWYSGLRMVIFGLMAAVVTFGLGRLIGTSIAG
jgi:VIT1/CCC1 family predicted Fe2+/Mn2+ transporter